MALLECEQITDILADVEKAYVMHTLTECGGNKKEAASLLGISRKALYDKLARWKEDERTSDGDVYSLGQEETMPIEEPAPGEEE